MTCSNKQILKISPSNHVGSLRPPFLAVLFFKPWAILARSSSLDFGCFTAVLPASGKESCNCTAVRLTAPWQRKPWVNVAQDSPSLVRLAE